ncbi:peptidylprolyl isomerase [Winogradskyella aurantiaca]|uniref:peptidylprolyl isomerase n=1 Tax=Winogradskyella aurantiaca TaxID=2219558 RepID=UPI000E1D6DF1|nr:peptidylprolyl isomerase [Winogradskyella aurantiaca]
MNYKSILSFSCFFLVSFFASTQNNSVLLVVNNDSITSEEFLKVYSKNLDLVKDEDQKDLDNYLELFIEYQLKLNEAKRLGLDKDQNYIKEFENYKRQLTRSYIAESKVTEALVKEAYDRMKLDVKAAHILVRLEENETDTLAAYNKALLLKERLQNEDLESLKEELHDGKSMFVEDLGYFSAFRMVYSFETMAYKTEVGTVSRPFRTKFGYHVVKVLDKRSSRGTMTAAHIMVANQQKDSTIIPEERIKTIYMKLESGDSFENLAKQFSDDKGSAAKGGELRPFKSGELSSLEFEEAVYSLKADGDISKPFETKFGWHIVKRLKLEPLADFESLKTTLQNRVKRDSRSKIINAALVEELRSKYMVKEDDMAKTYFVSIMNDDFFKRQWKLPEGFPTDKPIFSINEKHFTYQDFGKFLLGLQRNYFNKKEDYDLIYDRSYNNFFNASIIKFREENLVNENPEFAAILKEYQDGLLLFELMETQVWNRAVKDSIGLKTYHKNHAGEYQWNKRVEVIMASSSNKKELNIETEMFNLEGIELLRKEQSETGSDVIYTLGIFDVGSAKLPEELDLQENKAVIYEHNGSFHLIKVIRTIPSGPKTFEEARGQLTGDYQQSLEAEWLAELKQTYPVWVNQEVFNDLKRNY